MNNEELQSLSFEERLDLKIKSETLSSAKTLEDYADLDRVYDSIREFCTVAYNLNANKILCTFLGDPIHAVKDPASRMAIFDNNLMFFAAGYFTSQGYMNHHISAMCDWVCSVIQPQHREGYGISQLEKHYPSQQEIEESFDKINGKKLQFSMEENK